METEHWDWQSQSFGQPGSSRSGASSSVLSSSLNISEETTILESDYKSPFEDSPAARVEKFGGNVHSKPTWFSDMEEAFMVNSY